MSNHQQDLVLIALGFVPIKTVEEIQRKANLRIKYLVEKNEYYRKALANADIQLFPQLRHDHKWERLVNDPEKIWRKVVDDHQTFMLYDRCAHLPNNSFYKVADIIVDCLKCQAYLEKNKPKRILFFSTPHHITTWIFARVAEELGIPVFYFQSTIVPWRYFLLEGLRQHPRFFLPRDSSRLETESHLFLEFVRQKRSGMAVAMPHYERCRLEQNKGRYYSFFRDLRKHWKRPHLVINKARCFFNYRKLAICEFGPEEYFVFFLHFQPERTTLPEGYGFAQQLTCLALLAATLPEHVNLYVKEHPSTFTNYCSLKGRQPSYYDKLLTIPRVKLVSVELDPYVLIDKSIGVATVTGTVAFEALIRGKTAVIFGSGPIKLLEHPRFHEYKNANELRAFLSSSRNERTEGYDFLEYFNLLTQRTFSGLAGQEGLNVISESRRQLRVEALTRGAIEFVEAIE